MISTYAIRRATVTDASIITQHRRKMFEDMQAGTPAELDAMDEKFAPWITDKLGREEYLGWFAATDQGAVIAGAGLWVLEWCPTPMDQAARRGYVMNVYVHPDFRRQGLARRMMQIILDYCRAHELRVVTLHASPAGRSVYASLGFRQTNEMQIQLPISNF